MRAAQGDGGCSVLDVIDERPLSAEVAVSNTGSVRVLEKCGFVFAERRTTDVDELVFVRR